MNRFMGPTDVEVLIFAFASGFLLAALICGFS